VDNVWDYQSYSKWRADSTLSPYIQIEAPSSKSPNMIGIFNHNFDEIGGTIKLQYYNGSSYSDLATISVNGGLPILQSFTAHAATKFRLQFTSPTDYPELAILFLGVYTEFPYPPDAPMSPNEEGINAKIEISEGGHNLPSLISYFPRTVNLNFSNITRTWFDTYYAPFWDNYAKYLLPFFFAEDLDNLGSDIDFGVLNPSLTKKKVLSALSINDSLPFQMQCVSTDQNYIPLSES
jgi:hypothetical protein